MPDDEARTTRVALLGGSFDPPHVCHLLISSYVLQVVDVDQVWWLPCASHAFGKRSAPFEARLALCELATRHREDIVVSDVEARLDPPSYTLDTVDALRREHPDHTFVWIAGSDLLGELPRWHRYAELLATLRFVIVRRGDTWESPPPGCRHEVLPLQFPDVSSTQVREAIVDGGEVEGLADRAVLEAIRERGLYRS
jgi:nicotinate-nucleotide adenylyltransferase